MPSSTQHVEQRTGPSTFEEVATEHIHQVNEKAGMKGIVHDAKVASDAEHHMPLWEGLKTYPKAIAWSLALSSCIIMEGYDTLLLGSFYAMPAFNRKYGQPDGQGGWTLSAAWQIGLGDGSGIGSIVGVFMGGWLAEKYGYKRILGLALIMITAFIFITFFSPNLIALEIGIVLCGIPWGIFQTITVTYAAEVCPTKLRCYLTNYINLCWIIGQLIGSGVLRGMTSLDNQWSYKIPFAVQWAWPLPIFVAVCLAPESPWWLVRHGRIEEAKKSLNALASNGDWFNADDTVAMMIHTNEVEIEINASGAP
jgi:SP family general alpha glucoside:H+ symporter-like MFS transporter